MLGLVLEGGGAKGSYHAGAIKAFYENGIRFDGVMGTSIGAINGAILAQGDIEKCIGLWENFLPSQIIDVDDQKILNLYQKKFDISNFKYFFKLLFETVANKGFPVKKTMELLKNIIDEDKIRSSKIDYGIVTVSVSDRMPMEIFKEEIPYGTLHDYIMASAYFPAFRNDPIYGKKYLDGGLYDNLPINPLIRKGYDEIFAVRTMSNMPRQSVIDDTVKVTYIIPSDDIGGTISINNESIEKNMKMGYYDTLRVLKNYQGNKYYFYDKDPNVFDEFLCDFCISKADDLKKLFELDEQSDNHTIISKMVAEIRTQLKCSYALSDYQAFLLFLEKYGKEFDIERYKIYDINNYLQAISKVYECKPESKNRIIEYMKQFFTNKTEVLFDLVINNCMEKSQK